MVATAILALFAAVPRVHAAEEDDSLECIKAKDLNKVNVGGVVTLGPNLVSIPGCTVTKVTQVCLRSSVNSADDPHGTALPVAGYVCFKVKCDGTVPTMGEVSTQFGAISLSLDAAKGAKTICVPYT
jgi:hypothetical protein